MDKRLCDVYPDMLERLGVYPEWTRDCMAELPEDLYTSLVLDGAPEDDQRLALKAADAGFDFHSWTWNEFSQERTDAIEDLKNRFMQGVNPGSQEQLVAELEAQRVVAMCDLAAFGQRFQNGSEVSAVSLAYDRMGYDAKVDMLQGKMLTDPGPTSPEMDDKYVVLEENSIRELYGCKPGHMDKDVCDEEGRADEVRVSLGLGEDYRDLILAANVAREEMDALGTDGLMARYAEGYDAMCAAKCTPVMLDALIRDMGMENVATGIWDQYGKTLKSIHIPADQRYFEAQRRLRQLAYAWDRAKNDPGFPDFVEQRGHGGLVENMDPGLVRFYDFKCNFVPMVEAVDAARQGIHLDEIAEEPKAYDGPAASTYIPGESPEDRRARLAEEYNHLSAERAAKLGEDVVSEMALAAQEAAEDRDYGQ